MTAEEIGERRHEQCRYGVFSSSAFVMEQDGSWAPSCPPPLCAYDIPAPVPPIVKRLWGGQIELARDCARCVVYSPLIAGEA